MSCYGLTYEPNTPLAVLRRLGRVVATPEEREVEMLRLVRKTLSDHGLPAYEVSNYARPGRESRHNLAYWHGESYAGLGPSAASHVAGWRFRNDPHLGRWERAIEAGESAAIELERLTADERAGELAWLNLRTAAGIDAADFARRTGRNVRSTFADPIRALSAAGLVEVDSRGVRLTDAAWPLADGVASEFLNVV